MKKQIDDFDPATVTFAPEKGADGKEPKLAEVELTHGYVPLHAEPSEDGVYEKCAAGSTVRLPIEEAQALLDIGRARIARVVAV